LQTLQDILIRHKDSLSIIDGLQANLREQLVTGLSGSTRSLLVAGAFNATKRSIIVVTHNLLQAQKLHEDLHSLLPTTEVHLFPVNDMIAAELSISSPETLAERLHVLNYFAAGGAGILITPLSGIKKILPPKQLWLNMQVSLQIGSDVDLHALTEQLITLGYVREHMVSAPGDFSIRGAIIDIYPLTEEHPVRIELFDTEIDSIRSFNADNQRSLAQLSEIVITPATELIATKEQLMQLADQLGKLHTTAKHKVKDTKIKAALASFIENVCEKLRNGVKPHHLGRYASLLFEQAANIFDYFPEESIVFFDEMSKIHELNEQMERDHADYLFSLISQGEMLNSIDLTHSLPTLLANMKKPRVYLALFLRNVPNTNPQNIVNFSCKPMQNFHGQIPTFKSEVERWLKSNYTIVLQGTDAERQNKLAHVLRDFNFSEAKINPTNNLEMGILQISEGSLHSGFELPLQKLVVVTEQELFTQKKRKNFARKKISNAERIRSYTELKVGDFVVHVNHGIGKYLGIETLLVDGVHKDFLNIRYAADDKLFVPVDQIDAIQKYVGSEDKNPKLYKLGGSDWKRAKTKVRASVEDIADELTKLYAEREVAKGFAFSPDDGLQREFESTFPYPETEDQLRSIVEIKKDMERTRPMDRLLCGDVGYGKTEVAIRAAFKAINDNKQVAILVPTTILAQQHYETLRERFQDFPINIGLLSRFRTKKQQTETLKSLKTGIVDVVVGTHRLLSADVEFNSLGLLIVDEEQRFGVKHKERVKQLKTNIDVLTLTATPIPRTLHMSMLGVRDLSVIETPPENRFPIQTYVMEYNPSIVREVIERELARSGQVFFLHNRTADISKKATEISALVPEARVAYAHGKMSESELESVIYSFLHGEFDVLVSTTIIETGIDIPNVNTLIIHDADKMGLSQLYQLRGRVGRSNRIAYAYFTYKKDKVLTEIAEKRLQAIKEFTELGSGFKIAMRDLSIRGAGNLLGAEQHGFIESVGFDMYSQLLTDAINARKGTQPEEKQIEIEIDVTIDAYIPESYINNSNQKIEMYKLFKSLQTPEEVSDIQDELIDRFGEYPKEVDFLIKIAELKIFASIANVTKIWQNSKKEIHLMISEETTKKIDGAKIFTIIEPYGRLVGLGLVKQQMRIVIDIKKISTADWLAIAIDITSKIPSAFK